MKPFVKLIPRVLVSFDRASGIEDIDMEEFKDVEFWLRCSDDPEQDCSQGKSKWTLIAIRRERFEVYQLFNVHVNCRPGLVSDVM